MDRDLTSNERRQSMMRRVVPVAIAIAAIAFSLAATMRWLRPSVRRRDLQTARVERGSIDAVVQASGIVEPANEQVVSSPVEARVLRIGRRAGDRVRVGDELLTLDTTVAQLDLTRLGEKLAQKENEATQLRLKIDETLAGLQSQLEQKKLDDEIARLKSEQTRRLRGEGLVSEQDALLAATAQKKSAIEIAQLEQNAARARRTAEAQLQAVALDASMLRRDRDESRRQLDLAMMRATRDGIVTSIVQEEGATVRRGDVLARIADLSTFRVVATVSDTYVPRIASGMRAKVKVDDATIVGGTVDSIDPRIVNGVATLHIALDPDAHARLRNNLRVDVSVVIGSRNGVLTVKRGALGGETRTDVYLVKSDRLVRVPVAFGMASDERVEIVSGAAAGDEMVISNMNDYEGMKELRLK
ncbi:MAG: HlyD family efflux transporter periplasmic adaptor subunit [Acidobacteria bacterium]|nr:HlyD family efflux transporter periplasmic adaptor subunit [Acidobacteriota bacterium]